MVDPGTDRRRRVVVAAFDGDEAARVQARAMLMSGYEVVFVGGHQLPDQVAWTAVAEDAGLVVVDGPQAVIEDIEQVLATLSLSDVAVQSCADRAANLEQSS